MRLLGIFLLLTGCFLVFTAVVLLGLKTSLPAFVIAGAVVELAGLAMMARSFITSKKD